MRRRRAAEQVRPALSQYSLFPLAPGQGRRRGSRAGSEQALLRCRAHRCKYSDPGNLTVGHGLISALRAWLDRTRTRFRDRIVNVDGAVADQWGRTGARNDRRDANPDERGDCVAPVTALPARDRDDAWVGMRKTATAVDTIRPLRSHTRRARSTPGQAAARRGPELSDARAGVHQSAQPAQSRIKCERD